MEETIKKDKSAKGLTIFIIVLIALLGVLAFFPISKSWPSSYNYKGPTGWVFNFDVDDRYPGVTYHILEFYGGDVNSSIRRAYRVPFEYSPEELEEIPVPDGLRANILRSRGVFITRDHRLTEETEQQDIVAITTISRILGKEDVNLRPYVYGIPTYSAITEGEGAVLNCVNATSTAKIIWLKRGEENRIYYDEDNDNCVVLEFKKDRDMVKLATRLVYTVIGVMP